MNLNAAASASPGRRLLLPALSVRPRRSAYRGGEEAAGPTRPARPKVSFALFGTEDGARRGTRGAMSRRKLGSRPQHLSAIQGKPSAAAAWGHFYLSGWGWGAVIVYPRGYSFSVLV